jgi:hypothetical protein
LCFNAFVATSIFLRLNKMANKWITHIKKTMKTMKSRGTYKKGMGLKQVIKEAKKSWHKVKGKRGGGEDSSSEEEAAKTEDDDAAAEPPMGGRRRRKHGKTQRRRKH